MMHAPRTGFLASLAAVLLLVGLHAGTARGQGAMVQTRTLASLQAIPPGSSSGVYRLGYYQAGDGGDALYTWSAAPCSINGGQGDGGAQVAPQNGPGCWLANLTAHVVTPLMWGAKCDGATDDSAAFAAMFAALGQTGGSVLIPATGHPCVLQTGQLLPGNTAVRGVSLHHWSGLDVSNPAIWAAAGSWIECNDPTNPCFTISATGTKISELNFIYNQPAPPSSGNWAPVAYPYTIEINNAANYTGLEDISITAATNCIDWEGPSSGVAGIASYMRNIYFNGCYAVGTRFARIDNTLAMDNLRYDNWWYADNAAVVAYIESHKVDWDIHYLANAQASNVEFYQSFRAIQLTNNSVASGFGTVTFAAANLELTNISFNEVCQAIFMPGGNGTVSSGMMANVIAFADTSTQCAVTNQTPAFFNLASDEANWTFSNVEAGDVQTLFAIGYGKAGQLSVQGLTVQAYSAFQPSAPAFMVSAGASFILSGSAERGIHPGTKAGPLIGPGLDGSQGYQQPMQVGGSGAVFPAADGAIQMNGSSNPTRTGFVSFWLPSGVRNGYVGFASASGLNVTADNGAVSINPNAAIAGSPNLQVASVGGNLLIQGPLPATAPSQHCALWVNGGVVNLTTCP